MLRYDASEVGYVDAYDEVYDDGYDASNDI